MVKKLICAVFLFLGFPELSAAEERYMIGYAGFAGFQASMWAVKDLGLLNKYGLDGEVIMLPGSIRQIQALVGDSIHFGHVDAAGSIRAITGGADVVLVGASLNKFPFSFVTQKEIRKPAGLVGKKIGVVGFGSAHDLAMTLLLKEWNIPRQSVTIVQSGGAANRLVALAANSLDATLLSYPEIVEANRMGMNVMSDFSELKSADYPITAVAVRRAFLEQKRDTVKRFMKANAEGTYQFMTDKQKAFSIYKRRLKQNNPKALEETYQYFAPKFSYPTRVSQNGLRNTLDLMATENPKVATDLGKYLDESVLDELEKEGFFRRITGK